MKNEQEVQIPTFDELIGKELKKYDSIVPKVEELKKEFLPLKIESIEDKEGYELVKNALKFMRDKRHEIEDKRKELKADSLKYGKAVDEKAKEIQALISPIEEHLRAEKERVDTEIKEIKEKAEKEAQAKMDARLKKLFDLGFTANMEEFVWVSKLSDSNNQSVHKLNIEVWEDDRFEQFCDKMDAIIQNEIVALKEKLEKEAKEKEEFQKQQAELQEQQNKLRREQEEMAREMEAIKAERTTMRLEVVKNMGLVLSGANYCYKDKINQFQPLVPIDMVQNASKADWDENMAFWSNQLVTLQLKDVEIQNQRDAEEYIRLEELKRNAELEAKEKLEKEQQEAKLAEQARLDSLGDAEKYRSFLEYILSVDMPTFKVAKFKDRAENIINHIKQEYDKLPTKK